MYLEMSMLFCEYYATSSKLCLLKTGRKNHQHFLHEILNITLNFAQSIRIGKDIQFSEIFELNLFILFKTIRTDCIVVSHQKNVNLLDSP